MRPGKPLSASSLLRNGDPRRRPLFETAPPARNLHDALFKDIIKPFEVAAKQIVKIMEEVAPTLKRYQIKDGVFPAEQKVRKPDKSKFGGLTSILLVVYIDPFNNSHSFVSQTKLQEHKFQHGASSRKRFTYSTSPWNETDRQALQKSAKNLDYWNNELGNLFPTPLQHSLFAHAVPAKMVCGNTWEPQALQAFVEGSNLHGTEILKSASLWHSRLELEEQGLLDSKEERRFTGNLEKYPRQYQQMSYQQSFCRPETGLSTLG